MSEISLTDGEVYRDEDWPHGLRCAECSRLFSEGDRYSERLDGFIDECPTCLIVCVACAVPSRPEKGNDGVREARP